MEESIVGILMLPSELPSVKNKSICVVDTWRVWSTELFIDLD